MTLSIIIPVFNVEEYIEQCLLSVLEPETSICKDYEVIIVNDGSQDRSMDIVRQTCKNRNNVKIIEQDNKGLSSARTAGLSYAIGEYIWFLDSDDYLTSDAIKYIVSLIKSNKAINDVIMMPLCWSYKDQTQNHFDFKVMNDAIYEGRSILRNGKLPVWATPRFVIHRRVFSSEDLYFPAHHIHEDEYFGRVLLYQSRNVLVIKDSLYHYRQREGSIMSGLSIKSSYDILSQYKLLANYCKKKVNDDDKKWFHRNIAEFLLQSYKKVPHLYKSRAFKQFKKKNAHYILKQEISEDSYSIKERFWLAIFIISPKLYSFLSKK